MSFCQATAAMCKCRLKEGHEGPHECDNEDRCDGSWIGDIDGDDFKVIRFPKIGPPL